MNRPLSMTSFGQGSANVGPATWSVEIRSVNHRYSDIRVKIPAKYAALEDKIKKEISRYFSRGHVDAVIDLAGDTSAMELAANLPLARSYHQCLQAICSDLKLDEKPGIGHLLTFRDIITTTEREDDLDALWPPLQEALNCALGNSLVMREAEGQALKDDLAARLDLFHQAILAIEQDIPDLQQKRIQALKERLDNLLSGVDIDPMRLAQEVAIMADKSDVTEEVVRLKSHIEQFSRYLDSQEPVGRRLDFLLQEFLREVNTLASKISDNATAHATVELKGEIEKLREQIQNIE